MANKLLLESQKGSSRTQRTIRSLMTIGCIGVILATWNAWSSQRDILIVLGNESDGQHQFFLTASERPDIQAFFKSLKPHERRIMASNIGRYSDPEIAKLCGTLLSDFDADSRKILTRDLSIVAKLHPESVAKQLTVTGSFQVIGVFSALNMVGDAAIPLVTKQLEVADARLNASDFLVSKGDASTPFLLPYLDSKDKDIRAVTAETIGKIGTHEAVPALTKKWASSTFDEGFKYLSALCLIGDVRTESILLRSLDDPHYSDFQKALVALGLGRIGTARSIDRLWRLAASQDEIQSESGVQALQTCGNASLTRSPSNSQLVLRVAGGIAGPKADNVISTCLADPRLRNEAVRFCSRRPNLVPALLSLLPGQNFSEHGQLVDMIAQALLTTNRGQQEIPHLQRNATFGAIVTRRHLLGVTT